MKQSRSITLRSVLRLRPLLIKCLYKYCSIIYSVKTSQAFSSFLMRIFSKTMRLFGVSRAMMYKCRLTVQLSVYITDSDVNCEILAPNSKKSFQFTGIICNNSVFFVFMLFLAMLDGRKYKIPCATRSTPKSISLCWKAIHRLINSPIDTIFT